MSGPRIKDLNQLSTILHLIAGILSNALGQLLENRVQEFGFIKGHFLDFQIFLARLALHQVGGEGVGTTDKAQDGSFGSDFFAKCFQGFSDKGSST